MIACDVCIVTRVCVRETSEAHLLCTRVTYATAAAAEAAARPQLLLLPAASPLLSNDVPRHTRDVTHTHTRGVAVAVAVAVAGTPPSIAHVGGVTCHTNVASHVTPVTSHVTHVTSHLRQVCHAQPVAGRL